MIKYKKGRCIFIKAKLHDYQKKVGNFIVQHPKCGIFLELGLGKTLITLAVLEALYNYEQGHILIIAPKSIARATWANEIKKWDIKLPYQSLIVNENGKSLSRAKRHALYESILTNRTRTVYFINQELLKDLIDWCPRDAYGQKIWAFQTVVIDELQGFKSHSSARFKALKTVMPAVARFIGLTGTPTPNGIDDIWSEIYLMDNGVRLGANITSFRAHYMRPGFINEKGIVCNWNPQPGAEQLIYQKINDIVISLKNTQLKLPPVTFTDDIVYMSQSETKKYQDFKKTAVIEFGLDIYATAKNAAVMQNKLSQLASGTIYTIDADGNSTGQYETIHQQKLERLKSIRENTDDNLLVAYFFKSEKDAIVNYCKENDIPCEVFDSSKADDYVTRWNNNEIPMLLLQPASAGHGLNLQYGGHTLVWYTLPWSLEHYLQTNGRVYRQGQTKPVIIHHILTDNTIDKRILSCLTAKDCSEKALLDAVQLELFNRAITE